MTGLAAGSLAGTVVLAGVVGSIVLLGAWLLGATVLRAKPALRHLVLHAALLVYLLGPLWTGAARALPEEARQVVVPAGRALAFLDAFTPAQDLGPDGTLAAGGTNARSDRAPGAADLLAAAGMVWALGAALLLLRLGRAWFRIRHLRRQARPLDGELETWAQAVLGQRFPERARRGPWPPIRVSAAAVSPMVAGVLRPVIVLPTLALELDRAQLAHVLVHEMGHILRGDLLVGLLERVVAAVHWPNPLVHICRRALARAREESCDDLVLASTRPTDYAHTLLAVASAEPERLTGAGALGIGISPPELEPRIRRMLARVAPPTATPLTRGGRSIPALTALLTLLGGASSVALTASAATPPPSMEPGKRGQASGGSSPSAGLDEVGAQALFQDAGATVEGAFVLIDLTSGAVTTLNPALAGTRFTPVSTYKILIALCALENGVATDERMVLPWNGKKHEIAAWNRDLDLQGAMQTSSNWYFEELHRRLGEARMRAFVERLRFGTPGSAEGFPTWTDGGLTISPLEQAQFLARLAAGRLPVSPRSLAILRRIMLIEERGGVALRAKTGTAALDRGGTLAWLVGTVEHPARKYAFATFFRGTTADRPSIVARRHAITRRLLSRLGALPPEMAP